MIRSGADARSFLTAAAKLLGTAAFLWLAAAGGAEAATLSRQQAFAKAISILKGDPYGKTEAEVSGNIKQAQMLPNGGSTPCGAMKKPIWQFHVVVRSAAQNIDGYLVLDARYGKLLCANLPMLD